MPGIVEVACPWGGTASLDATGDLAVIQDTTQSSPATIQRIIQNLNTNPIQVNAQGVVIGRPDDLFNPTNGAGVRRLLGSNPTDNLLSQIQAAVLSGLQSDPGILAGSPVVVVTYVGNATVEIDIDAITNLGVAFTVPTQPLQIFQTSGG